MTTSAGAAVEGGDPLFGDAEFGLGASPEEIGRSGRDDEEVFAEVVEAIADLLGGEVFHEGVDEQDLMAGGAEELAGGEEFEREVGVGTAEVGGAFKGPAWVDEGVFQDATSSGTSSGAAVSLRCWRMRPAFSCQKVRMSARMSSSERCGRQPVSRWSLAVSEM